MVVGPVAVVVGAAIVVAVPVAPAAVVPVLTGTGSTQRPSSHVASGCVGHSVDALHAVPGS